MRPLRKWVEGKVEKLNTLSRKIWNSRYRHCGPPSRSAESNIKDTWTRVARAAAAIEPNREQERWAGRFYDAMQSFEFLPGGRILAGAGTGRKTTLFNCFVMGRVKDDFNSIFDCLKESAVTMRHGGGIGLDFSTLRPHGASIRNLYGTSSGPLSFMKMWDTMCKTTMAGGLRRGAMMAALRCDHPDVEFFINAKSDPHELTSFNLSVLVTDAFVKAVFEDDLWDLTFNGTHYRKVRARELWDKIMLATYEHGEPGVIFIDRVNAENNLSYCEQIRVTNPCGEVPLPPYGACLLGSINLAQLVARPFTREAAIDEGRLECIVATAVRFLDNIIDASWFPLPEQELEAKSKRRVGLGITGLGDALILCGIEYGSQTAATLAGRWMRSIKEIAYHTSAALAREKGAFPRYEAQAFLAGQNVQRLPNELQQMIARGGLRNGTLTSIAPAGAISLLAGNVSGGIEPVFEFLCRRNIVEGGGLCRVESVEDYAHALLRSRFGEGGVLPKAFIKADQIRPRKHLEMQAAVQPHVDSGISKTINCSENIDYGEFKSLYIDAHKFGLKGCTVYRAGRDRGSVLSGAMEAPADVVREERTMFGGWHQAMGGQCCHE